MPETSDQDPDLTPPPNSADLTEPADPDRAEQELADEIDDVVPSRGYHTLPVVGLGGSAGGLSAMQRFFENAGTEHRRGLCRDSAPFAGPREFRGGDPATLDDGCR